jgi:DNA end-binding protein Ku
MARSIWKGSIAFGLVNIPVSLSNAETKPDVQFHMVDSENHARIRYEKVNSETGEEVPWDRMVKGYEHDDGQFVLLTDEDLEAVQPKLTKSIEISEFVSLEEIDPLLFDKPYYLEPEKRGRKAYALLRESLRNSGKAGISRVVIRTREYLSAMFVRDDALILMLLRFPQEIRASSKLDLPSSTGKEWQPSKKELDLAGRLIDEMTEKWNPDLYHDEYRAALMDYIEKKIAGGETVADVIQPDSEKDDAGGKVLDLADYLQRSFKQSKKTSAAAPRAKKAARKNGTKKPATKKGRRSA